MKPPAWGQLLPGFSNPVFESQATFRQILKALSYPGRVVPMPAAQAAPNPLYPTTGAVCLTLLDLETPLWVDYGKTAEMVDWLRFHCGCPIVEAPSLASFGIFTKPGSEIDLEPFSPGEEEFPERSATLLIQVEGFISGTGRTFIGPGIRSQERIAIEGLTEAFWKAWDLNHHRYPLGIDVLFLSREAIVGLPRTTRVMESSCT
ncbi:MAG: phosphonate C-P lyase system protein PhnH [Desulfobacterota bacterium]|nr:phosphonate C-P lyase system protein PhnH [Thermodesulfobacteriota bacterium]